jgi:GTPase Era involved in 16S rRNA processing
MSTLLSLLCYVRGDNYNRVFNVKVPREEYVATLKKLIKEELKPDFDHIRADSLSLWNVSILHSERLQEDVESALAAESPLKASLSLKKFFPEQPEEEHVHIVVSPPSIPPRQCSYPFLS